jgi:hypothetical protein
VQDPSLSIHSNVRFEVNKVLCNMAQLSGGKRARDQGFNSNARRMANDSASLSAKEFTTQFLKIS